MNDHGAATGPVGLVLSRCATVGPACAHELASVLGPEATVVLLGAGSELVPGFTGTGTGVLGRALPGPAAADVAGAVAEVLDEVGAVTAFVSVPDLRVPGGEAPAAAAVPAEVLDHQLLAVQAAAELVVPAMVAAGGGRVVVVAEATGLEGWDRWDDGRGPAMWGLVGLVRTTARKVASQGVAVNAVRVGLVDTEPLARGIAGQPSVAAAVAQIVAETPGRRLGTADDVAAAVGFLASAGASYVTGVVLPVDGGLAMGFGA